MTSLATPGVEAAIASRKLWYHTLSLGPQTTTPGWFDLRPIVERMPWPDVEGKRCLDVGPYDGFLSFELERRGAASVVAADIADPSGWDWPVAERERGAEYLRSVADGDPGGGFEIAARALDSKVQRIELGVYDLSPAAIGQFDVVVCGSLLLHLKDPVRALEAIRSVCRERFLSAEQISPALTLLGRSRPLAQVRGGDRMQWSIPNVAAHRKLVEVAGFEIERQSRPYSIPLGVGHPAYGSRRMQDTATQRALNRLVTRGSGMPHAALLAKPI